MSPNLLGIIFIALSFQLYGEDMGQFLPGMYGAENEDVEHIKKYEPDRAELVIDDKDPFLTFEEDKELPEVGDGGVDYISKSIEMPNNIDKGSKRNYQGSSLPGRYENYPQYLEYNNKEILDEYKYDGKDRINIGVIYDTYTYTNSANTFDRVYRDSLKSDVYGILTLSWERLIVNGDFKFLGGIGTGFGYNGGKGIFEGESLDDQNTYSERTQISLYSVPLEAKLSIEFPVSRYMSLYGSGGPSAIFVQEHRNDKEQGESKRDRRQFGLGYFAEGAVKIYFGNIYKDLGFKQLSVSQINRFAMNLFARNQYYKFYKNENKNITIQGTSFGLGFSYDYL